mmetsp:Transcript_71082/g.140893  ORF Transcript_71082/g.140893 Transcript_71082/m.140893 type:complete len:408 (-) Transcript_71082:528-1751(-)
MKRRITAGGSTSRRGIGKPIYAKNLWSSLPSWISLHHERGRVRKCWEGHRLLRDWQDGRRHGECDACKQRPTAGTPILSCAECRFTVCSDCNCRPRMPPLDADPLFCGPHSPRLLVAPQNVAGMGRGTVIVCPGGNYEFLCPKEGFPIAQWLASHGIAAVVLRYRLLPHHDHEDALDDLDAAAALVRQARGGPVAAIGFSAGGHLVATHALRAEQRRMERVQTRSRSKPLDAQLLIYPAIDGTPWLDPHKAGFFNSGVSNTLPKKARALDTPTEALLGGEGFSAPPTFLVGSTADTICPPSEHSDLYVEALREHQVRHTYVKKNLGEHGFGLGDSPGEWTSRAIKFLTAAGFGWVDGWEGEDEEEDRVQARAKAPSPLTLFDELPEITDTEQIALLPENLALVPVHT